MSDDPPHESLTEFITAKADSEWSVQVVNRTGPEPIREMVADLFDGLDLAVSDTELGGLDDDQIFLINDGTIVASSPLQTIRDALLLVNSDLYTTGSKSIDDIDTPDVILQLSDTVFTLQGYPESHKEKLVLTLISRYIEYQALTQGTGTLRSSFQRLSRLNDEQGTKEAYERLGQTTAVDVHVYGLPDWTPPEAFGLTVHGTDDEELQKHWFVVYAPTSGQAVAMVAHESKPGTWNGYWTFDAEEVEAIERYVKETF